MIIGMQKKRHPSIVSILGEDKGEGESSPSNDMEACAEDLLSAVEAKDVKGVVDAFKALFACCESQPHEEYGE